MATYKHCRVISAGCKIAARKKTKKDMETCKACRKFSKSWR